MNSRGNVSPKRKDVFASLFPERRVVSFDRRQGRFVFFSMISDLLHPEDVVIDFGAGRGHQAEVGGVHSRALAQFKGRCRRIIGVDVDPVVLNNPYVDEAYVIDGVGRAPLPDGCADLIFAYAVVEHVTDPEAFSGEIYRLLKPGGWFCAWTPNKWGYVGLGTRLVPNRLHARLLRSAEPGGRGEKDVFPTYYRLNTLSAVRRHFNSEKFYNKSFSYNGHPSYNFGRVWIARIWLIVMFLSPPAFRQSLFIFTQKRSD